MTLTDLLDREGVPETPSALYLCAGADTMPFTFLSPEYVAHRGVDGFVMPRVFVYVDQEHPRGARQAVLAFEDDRGTRIRTTGVEEVSLDAFPAWVLDVEIEAENPAARVSARVVRIRARNQEAIPLVAEARWIRDAVIAVCDGCRFGGQEEGRRENDLRDPTSIRCALSGPPTWWVTDHWRPGGSVPQFGEHEPWRFSRRTQLSSQWGHSALSLFGASLFEVQP